VGDPPEGEELFFGKLPLARPEGLGFVAGYHNLTIVFTPPFLLQTALIQESSPV
jgi:hypothetical protein